MRLVIIESPYAGDVERNVRYARACLKDCLSRGEAPLASHLLYTQEGVLDDADPAQRKLGMEAGHAWLEWADAVVVYKDLGISAGMTLGVEAARAYTGVGPDIEYRQLPGWEVVDKVHELATNLAEAINTTLAASDPVNDEMQRNLVAQAVNSRLLELCPIFPASHVKIEYGELTPGRVNVTLLALTPYGETIVEQLRAEMQL